MEAGDAFLWQIFGHNKPSSAAAFSPPRHLPPLAAIFNQIYYATPHLFARSLQSAHPYQSSLLLLHGAIGNRGPPPATVTRARLNQIYSTRAAEGAHPIFMLDRDRTFYGKNCFYSNCCSSPLATSALAKRSTVAAYHYRTCSYRCEQAAPSDPFSHRLFPFRGSFYRKPPVTTAQRNPSALLL
ncbi:hypothetical protein BHM03_00034078 [Ensete ventricosum]|nr:hypothetical protein BHM03_00034078 [Ensete ventricosum]